MSEDSIDILRDNGIHLFTGDVDEEICEDVIRFIMEENLLAERDFLTLVVNSPGGYVSCGFSVIDVISGSKIPVRTLGLGILASMGLLIFISGKRGERTLTPNTLIMSHQFTGSVEGKEHELLAGIKQNSLVSGMIMRHLKKHTGLTEKKIRKYLLPANDVYLSAQEALELNLCDKVRLFN